MILIGEIVGAAWVAFCVGFLVGYLVRREFELYARAQGQTIDFTRKSVGT